MEKWLFLHKEPRTKIEAFSRALDEIFEGAWNFSKFVPSKTTRQSVKEGYSIGDCLIVKGELRDQKLVIGQVHLGKPMIKYCFRNQDIWADFMVEDTPRNYIQVDSLFLPTFGHKIENYPLYQEVNQRPY